MNLTALTDEDLAAHLLAVLAMYGVHAYTTADPYPTTLPGTPA